MLTPTLTSERQAPTALALAEWTQTMKRSILRQMLAVVSRPGILSFAGGLPAPELFPTLAFAEATQRVLTEDPRALQYGPPFEPLRQHVVRLMNWRGVRCTVEQVFITTGAQQGLNIASRLFMDRGAQVMVEQMVYTGIQQALAPYQPAVLTIPTDLERGIEVEAVADHLVAGARPAFLYVIPEAHNPLGVSIQSERREALINLARRYGLPIVEDDPYGFLHYDQAAREPLRALDDSWVLYVGSFSKILAPALRLGWMVVPEALTSKLTVIKEAFDLETSALIQRAVAAYLDAGHLPDHLSRLRRAYRARRDAMLAAMDRHFPAQARWTRPSGGMFIWVELPRHVDATSLLWQSVEEARVAFIPGMAFSASVDGGLHSGEVNANNCLRLTFSTCSIEEIEEGIARLGGLLGHVVRQPALAPKNTVQGPATQNDERPRA